MLIRTQINNNRGIIFANYNICELCSVRNCMNNLIVNVALEALYIHKEGRSDRVIDS
jgi:hypothetical protein